jgi:PAS domain S-box-containing protein
VPIDRDVTFTGPTRLYGRDAEVARLISAFDRTLRGGAPELVLVSGYSGVGKSSLVRELQRSRGASAGMFAGGKCDQHNSDMPYAALALALKNLVKQLLTRHVRDLSRWSEAIRDALGPNGKLITDLVPELTLVVGEQPPAPELPLQQAHSRFQLVLRRFIQVFARSDAPLVLFLDDLQWVDAATLDMIASLVGHAQTQHLLLIGAYRDNEVDSAHPLTQKFAAAKAAGAAVHEIRLGPLTPEHVRALVSDVLRCDEQRVAPLADVVHAKTAGNPFFAIQFLHMLAEENVLVMEGAARRWSWDMRPIEAAAHTDNVADLMCARLNRLPAACRDALRELACIGHRASAQSLALVRRTTEEVIHAELDAAVQQELVERTGNSYRFSHDRVQEAAYALTPASAQAASHLRIARLLAPQLSDDSDDATVFEIAGQFNRALDLIASNHERLAVAQLNLRAGIRAKQSAAYDAALRYLHAGAALVAAASAEPVDAIRFQFELELAEGEFLTGQLEAAEQRLAVLAASATDIVDQGGIACRRMDVCTALDESDRAVSVALDFLRRVGIAWSAHPSDEEVLEEYAELRRRSSDLTQQDIVGRPAMTDPVMLITVEVLTRLLSAACFTDFNLNSLITCKAINLSLVGGNCEASCVAYGTLSRIAGPRFGDFDIGFRFAKAGYELAERNPRHRFHASTCMVFATFTMRWMQHVRLTEATFRRAFDAANQVGDLLYASYSCCSLNSNLLFAGDALHDIEREVERGLAFARNAKHGLVIHIISAQLALIRSMRGETRAFGSFDDSGFDERAFEAHLSESPSLALALCWYWTRKMQARYLAGDFDTAAAALCKAEALLWTSSMFFEEAEFHFYAALTLAAIAGNVSAAERDAHCARIAVHHRRLSVWADNCPENFENRAALVSAEIARLEGRIVDAQNDYERAIRSARESRFPHHEALASELAARFYRVRGFDIISDAYLRHARHGYQRWGAAGKVRQLDDEHPHLGPDAARSGIRDTAKPQAAEFDSGVLIDVSQRISSEILLENVIDTFMKAALTHAGADRGVLILSSGGGQPRIEAEATGRGESVVVEQESRALDERQVPMTVVNYVLRTHETVVVSDTATDPIFGADPYIATHRLRATLCIPLLRGGELTGMLYLEHRFAAGAFAAARLAVLNVLASQVAIALENARLYRELSDREAKIRRLVDSNIIGIFIFSLDGTLLEANSAFLNLLGYSRDDLQRGRLNWIDLTPPEWHSLEFEVHEPTLRTTGVLPPFEKEYFCKDGSRAPVLVGAALFGPASRNGVGFVLDLSASKRAEAAARDSEIRLREVQHELAHANRVSTIGQLTAAISHEVKQPIAAMATNADAGLRWLSAQPPNVDKARRTLDLIVRDAMRAGDIIDRMRHLVRKAPPREEVVDINAAILEVVFMTRRDAEKHGVRVETRLATPAPLVIGDRVQLQQVVLNLIVNAIEAMSATHEGRRRMHVATSANGRGEVEIRVTDSGPGVPPEHMDRLFEPFFTTKETGMGIGLSVVHSVVQAHGGRLQVRSNERFGTTFCVSLPAAGDRQRSLS